MKWKRLAIFALIAISGGVVYYCASGYAQGRIDYDLLARGKLPIHAKRQILLSDGGTSGFGGRGYAVYRLHRILRAPGTNMVAPGYLGGHKLEWQFPIRAFARDREDSLFIPNE